MEDQEKELLDLLNEVTARHSRSSVPEPMSRIVRLFRLSDPRSRSRAARLVGRYSSYRTFLLRRLEEKDHRVRANVVESMWGIDSREVRSALHDALDDSDHRVRTNVLIALYRLGDSSAVRLLIEQSRHSSPAFRASAAWAMGDIKDAEFLDALNSLTGDDKDEVRQNATLSLSRLKQAIEGAPSPADGQVPLI
ncbi:MAG: HEAT repeat domain-containing protein [Bryobacteraceae bacterium]|jgi:HEAT repeat protein